MKSVFEAAYAAWSALAPLRSHRSRNLRFCYGDQWSDWTEDASGNRVREDRLIRQSGKQPLTNNLIRQLIKSVVGRFRTRCAEEGAYSSAQLRDLANDNSLAELDGRLMEEFLASGCAVQRVWHGERGGHKAVWVENVNIDDFFVNKFRDPRGWDIELVGMLHDMSLPQLLDTFARDNVRREAALTRAFQSCAGELLPLAADSAGSSFGCSARPGHCRVAEVWTLDARRAAGRSTRRTFRWRCRWFLPDGTLLDEYDSPFSHGGHPFAVKFYPLTDGQVHSFVEDVIDQQKAINRLIVQIDHIMANSAKGVLLFPIDQKPSDMDWADICRRWNQPDGLIPITGQGATLPHQVVSAGQSDGAYRLLELQMKLFEDVSGVSETLLGKGLSAARGSELYESQLRNAAIALADIFDSFTSFLTARNAMALTTIPEKS